MTVYQFVCEKGHRIALDLQTSHKKFVQLCDRMKRVCPQCHPENVRLRPYEEEEGFQKFAGKNFCCSKGHITTLHVFTNDMINVKWGHGADEYKNIEATPEIAIEMVAQRKIKCQLSVKDKNGRNRKCSCKLKEVDNTPLTAVRTAGIKTRVRVGDIWDQNKCPHPTDNHYETFTKHGVKDARAVETEFAKRNKLRVKKMRKKNKQRHSTPPGKILDKPTRDTQRGPRDKPPTKKDLNEGQ